MKGFSGRWWLPALAMAMLLSAPPAMAGAEGPAGDALAKMPLFVVIYRAGPAWNPGIPINKQPRGGHAAYMARLAADGRSLAAGPLLDINGGLMVLRAADMDEARRLLAADPALASGVFQDEAHPWRPVFATGGPIPVERPAKP